MKPDICGEREERKSDCMGVNRRSQLSLTRFQAILDQVFVCNQANNENVLVDHPVHIVNKVLRDVLSTLSRPL